MEVTQRQWLAGFCLGKVELISSKAHSCTEEEAEYDLLIASTWQMERGADNHRGQAPENWTRAVEKPLMTLKQFVAKRPARLTRCHHWCELSLLQRQSATDQHQKEVQDCHQAARRLQSCWKMLKDAERCWKMLKVQGLHCGQDSTSMPTLLLYLQSSCAFYAWHLHQLDTVHTHPTETATSSRIFKVCPVQPWPQSASVSQRSSASPEYHETAVEQRATQLPCTTKAPRMQQLSNPVLILPMVNLRAL